MIRQFLTVAALAGLGCMPLMAQAQAQAQAQEQVPGAGTVIASSERIENGAHAGLADRLPVPVVTDPERSAVVIAAWDLDCHLTPAEAREEVRGRLTLRNVSQNAVTRVPLQVSGALRWVAVRDARGQTLGLTQSPIATDADHTGYAQEAVISLPVALESGASVELTVQYGGTIGQSGSRMEMLGAAPERAAQTDWDQIAPTTDAASTALRGFGNVLWYPVAAPVALLGDGNKLVAVTAEQWQLGLTATMRLRLTVEYAGEPAQGAILNGVLQTLTALPDDRDAPVSDAAGVATTQFAAAPVGYGVPSLFLTGQQPVGDGLAVLSARPEDAEPYRKAAEMVRPMLEEWFGPAAGKPLLVLDHAGEPFAQGRLLVAQLAADAQPETIAPELVSRLSHAWFHVPGEANAWLEEGMAELMNLLWLERTKGREAALEQVRHAGLLVGLSERGDGGPGQPLIAARDEVFLRLKAALVLWQMRESLGDRDFREAVIAYRRALGVRPDVAANTHGFEDSVERSTDKSLAWLFNDWVYADKGLPDLTLVAANPRALPDKGGKSSGYLVAVELRNDGDAAAEVPVTVRAGTGARALTVTERVRVGAHATASTRLVFEGVPEVVEANDGSVPEMRAAGHTLTIKAVGGRQAAGGPSF